MALGDQAKIGISLPQAFPDGTVQPAVISRFAQRAEDLGYHSLWVQDRFMGRSTWLDPLGLLSFVAGVTYEIRLGVATMPLPWHNPARLAKSLASLDQLSGGRLIAGLSLGGFYVNENMPGTAPERRVAAFNEGLEVMQRLWTEEDVDAGRGVLAAAQRYAGPQACPERRSRAHAHFPGRRQPRRHPARCSCR